ncbi:MAG: TetR/AcrR family transcriptional regulator [Bacteroidia bacterium]|nr:TetR/AcrR family transcriptional regulator [Bacteroidia bacterium]
MEGQERILSYATEQFLKLGVRNVTMDDLAQQLGISKKTIYQVYQTKADLVDAVAEAYFKNEETQSDLITQNANNAIDELSKIVIWTISTFRRVSPNLIHEIQKFYPDAWRRFESFSNNFILSKMKQNLAQGIAEGLYRSNLDVEIMARLRVMQIGGSLQSQYFPSEQFDQAKIQYEIFEFFLRGIVSDAGREVLNTHLSHSSMTHSEPNTQS